MPDDLTPPSQPDGVTEKPAAPPPAVAPAPPSMLASGVGWAVAQVVNFVFLLALWGGRAVAIRAFGVEWANAIGFGFLGSFFGAFFFRSLIAGVLGKNLASKVPGLTQPQAPQPNTPVEGFREVVETVVFVVVLVLMLKS